MSPDRSVTYIPGLDLFRAATAGSDLHEFFRRLLRQRKRVESNASRLRVILQANDRMPSRCFVVPDQRINRGLHSIRVLHKTVAGMALPALDSTIYVGRRRACVF
jgi:hypothetical protein